MTGTLWAASLRHLLRHPAQLALALAGLALGVGTITAVDIATASSRRAFALSMEAVNGPATHQISAGAAGVDERLYVRLRAAGTGLPLAPAVEGYATVGGRAMQLLGVDPLADLGVRGPRSGTALAGAGEGARLGRVERWFTASGTTIMAARTAEELGLAPGDRFEVTVGGRTFPAELLDVIRGEDEAGFETILLTDIAQAQEWLGLVGRLSRIDLQATDDAAGRAALRRLAASLPPGARLETAEQRTAQTLDMTAAFTTNLQAMSLLALLVSAFLIYSAVSFAVVQRRRTFGILRALGATPAELLAMVLAEAAVLGAAGAALGVALGSLIGRELVTLVSRTINDLYFVVAVREAMVPAGSLVKAVAAGVGVALAAAALPALEAAHGPPQLGLRPSVLETRAVSASRRLLAASVLFAGAGGLVVALSGRSLLAGFVALFLLLLGVAALTPAALRALALASAKLAGRASPVARLAFGDVAASLSRTGVAVAALGVAVSAMIGVAVMVDSFRESLRDWLERTMRADVYVTAPGPGFARPERQIDPALVERLLAHPAVADHGASRRLAVDLDGASAALEAVELAAASYAGIALTEGDPAKVWPAFHDGAVVISEPLAWRLAVRPGDTILLPTPAGPRRFPIAGVHREYGNDRGTVLMDRGVYRRHFGDDAVTSLGLHLAPGADPRAVIAELRAAAAGRQALLIRSNAELRALSMGIFERTFVITRVLYWLAAGVAAIGLVSALLAWELERTRQLATLRALGLTPRGAAGLIEAQTGFMGMAALLAAIPAGLLTAVVLIDVINRRAFGWRIDLHVDPAQLGHALVLSLAAALVAGLYPALRAGRAPIASGIREE